MKRFLLIFSILVLILVLSSCMLIRGSSKPMIYDFTKSATLLSGQNISFSAKVVDPDGLSGVVFDLDDAPIPTTLMGTSSYTANWLGVYGYHKVTLFAVGAGGMVATKTDSFFVKDSTPPIVKAFYPDTISQNVNFPIHIDVYDSESGIQSVSLNVDGKNTPFSTNFDLSFDTLGSHYFTVTALNGQGLISTPTFYIDVVKPVNAKPYVQFTNMPEMISAGHQSTVTVYAYSPNGIQSVSLKVGNLSDYLSGNASNTYIFNFKVPSSEISGLYEATCTVVDGIGNSQFSTSDVLIAPPSATSIVVIPTIDATSIGMIKIPFFAASNLTQFSVSAYVNGVPVQVYGNAPNFYAMWFSSYGDDNVFSVGINNSIVNKTQFSVYPQPLKVESVTYNSTNVAILFSQDVYYYANPVFEITNGASNLILNKNDVFIQGNKVYIPTFAALPKGQVHVLGLKDQNGPVNLSFDLP